MLALCKREFRLAVCNLKFAIVACLAYLTSAVFLNVFHFTGASASLGYLVLWLSYLYLLFVPFLTCDAFSADCRSGIDGLLYSLPISPADSVLAKFFARLSALFILCAPLLVYPLILKSFGSFSLGAAYALVLIFFVGNAALLAISFLISALVRHAVLATVIGIVANVVFMAIEILAAYLPAALQNPLKALSLFGCLDDGIGGFFSLGSFLYLLVLTALAVFASVLVSEFRRVGKEAAV